MKGSIATMLTLALSPGDGLYKELAGKYIQPLCTREQDKRSQDSDSLLGHRLGSHHWSAQGGGVSVMLWGIVVQRGLERLSDQRQSQPQGQPELSLHRDCVCQGSPDKQYNRMCMSPTHRHT